MTPHDDQFPIPHKCNIWDYCTLSEDYLILFCVFCHKVVGYQKGNVRFMKMSVEEEGKYKQKEYSDETLNNSV